MAVYVVTGKLGGGKTLISCSRIRDYLIKGRTVATNLDIRLDKMFSPWWNRGRLIRLPDHIQRSDLDYIGKGSDSPDELTFGALVLDECGTWLNSRQWADQTRQGVIDWMLHARKLGWDVFLIIQNVSMLDKQAREALAEHVVTCKRTDRFKFFGIGLPKMHMAFVRYGTLPTDPIVERWFYRGSDLHAAYDTRQVFRPRGFPGALASPVEVPMPGTLTGLTKPGWLRRLLGLAPVAPRAAKRAAWPSSVLTMPPETRWQLARHAAARGYRLLPASRPPVSEVAPAS